MIVELLKNNGVTGIKIELSIFQMQALQTKMVEIHRLSMPIEPKQPERKPRHVLKEKLRDEQHYEELIAKLRDLQRFIDKIAPVPSKQEVNDTLFSITPKPDEDGMH